MKIILSLLEFNNLKDPISLRLRRAIPISCLTKNLIDVFTSYRKRFKYEYNDLCFNLMKEKIDFSKNPKDYKLILENGFLLYILLKKFSNIEIEENEEEIKQLLEITKKSQKKYNKYFKNTIFGELRELGKGFINTIQTYRSLFKEKVKY